MLDTGPNSDDDDAVRTPIVRDRAVVNIRAARLGRKFNSVIAVTTRARVSGRMLGWLLNTRETVCRETPAAAAPSRTPGGCLCGTVMTSPYSTPPHSRTAPEHHSTGVLFRGVPVARLTAAEPG